MAGKVVGRALAQSLVAQLGKDDDATTYLVDDPKPPMVIPTGSLDLDRALRIGGWPRGCISIISGPESCGKTSMSLAAARECQKIGWIPVYVDMERKLDLVYARSIGVDTGAMPLLRPKSIEAGFRILHKYADMILKDAGDTPILYVWDSLHAGVAESLSENWSFSVGSFGPDARVYSDDIKRFLRQLDEKRIAMLALSQHRVKIDPNGRMPATNKIGVSNASLHHAAVIVGLRKIAAIDTDSRTGKKVKATVVKNQCAGEGPVAVVDIINGTGPDWYGSVLLAAEAVGLAVPDKDGRKRTGWLQVTLPDGEAKLRASGMQAFAAQYPERFDMLVTAVRERFGTKADVGAVVDEDAPVVERDPDEEPQERPALPRRTLDSVPAPKKGRKK